MARSVYSRSPSPVSPSPSFSDISGDDSISTYSDQPDGLGPSISRPNSPSLLLHDSLYQAEGPDSEDSVTCLWEGCGGIFTHLPTLIEHIHNDHIGVHKSNYTCEWATCLRRGLAQTSRFALISHIRSHTGEKPFTCPRPECDKSFTRSDALAKHLRLQHNISPPAPGRGGSRKRKRGNDDQLPSVPPPAHSHTPPVPSSSTNNNSTSAFNTFKVEPHTAPESLDDSLHGVSLSTSVISPIDLGDREHVSYNHTNGRRSPSPHSPISPHASSPQPHFLPEGDEGYTSTSDTVPPHLMPHYVPSTNLILGRSPSMVMYLLMKAKHRYALEQHEQLLEELRVMRAELKNEREEKEAAVDKVLRGIFGSQAEPLIAPIPLPLSMLASTSSGPASSSGYANGSGGGHRGDVQL